MQGSGMLAVTFGVYWAARFFGLDDRDVRTLAFTTLIITNLMLIFANRSELSVLQSRGLSSNRALAWLVAGATAMLAAALFIPPVRELFFLSRLHALDLAVCATAGFVAILWLEILKLLTRSADIPPAAAAFRNDLEN
jgi:Ca2+-transporting ATPase